MHLLSSFHSIRFGLMVGIGGGVPSGHADIRLGDIVVSQPADTSGGVIQYDLGKVLSGRQFKRTGMLNRPPKILLTALATLQAHHLTEDSRIVEFISNIQVNTPRRAANFARPSQEDCLYQADYEHGASNTCINCDRSKLILRSSRGHEEPVIHYGLIASANQVVKDGRRRDQLAQDLGVYCVETEAAGLMNDFPCLVIRGICDYADSHKNKEWQGYAAAVAAAYAKELLLVVPINHIDSTQTARETLAHTDPTVVPVIENFLGRQEELEHLWHYLQPANAQFRKIAILHGLGGMGKTQLAVRFARDHKNDFTAVFWLSGKDRGTLLQSLSSALPRLPGQSRTNEAINDEDVEQQARHVLQWLALEGNSRWLIIFDNIDQYSPIDNAVGDAYDIGEFFPTADHGSILITTRLQGLSELGKSFPVHRLESNDAIQLLLQSSGLPAKNTRRELKSNPDILALSNRLDGLPLAIVIAGAFMRETGTNITEYLQYYQESWFDLQSQSSPGRQYQQGNILQTWMISYHEIQKRDPNAAELLLLLARFDNRDICTGNDMNLTQLNELALICVGHTVPSMSDRNYAELQRRLIPHANYVRHRDWGNGNIVVWGACLGLGNLYRNQGKLKEAEEMYQRALAGYDKALGPDHTSTLNTVHNLGILYSDQGKLKEAEEMYQRALVGFEKALGRDHTDTLNTVNNLGNLYSDQGKLKEAEKMYQRALAGKEKALGPDHTSTLRTINNLGLLYYDQGKLKEAEEMYQRALAGREKALGSDHTSTLTTVNCLGNLYRKQGKLKEAEEMYPRALAGYKEALGTDHPRARIVTDNLASLSSCSAGTW
ncbi:hypothetical protein CNMCM5793_007554 [Aspergillus hiratsukae]|uniref:Orc1-like AAA ATPase domain-containing protein n=2 Tax=Aspergillus hiratsukae TaxID=1194566 RepID=A0A8H6PI22_9EURO|nr:hypothetical protein CNMCM5793_007554 [Aspergillus hiratsukae]